MDRDRAETLRVSVGDVFATLTIISDRPTSTSSTNSAFRSRSTFRPNSQFRLQPDDLLNLYVRSQDGQMVPIGSIAHLGPVVAPALITLYNLYPSATIVGGPARGFSSGQSMACDGADRQQVLAERRLLRMDGDVLSGED